MAKAKDKERIQKHVNIVNRRAGFEYQFLVKYTAGIMLKGTEVKALRTGEGSCLAFLPSGHTCRSQAKSSWLPLAHSPAADQRPRLDLSQRSECHQRGLAWSSVPRLRACRYGPVDRLQRERDGHAGSHLGR